MQGALIAQRAKIQETFTYEIVGQLFLVLVAEFRVQCTLVNGLGQELRGVAAHVSLDLPTSQSTTSQRAVSMIKLEIALVVILDHDFHRDTEFADIVKHSVVVTRQTPGTVVEILAFIKCTGSR